MRFQLCLAHAPDRLGRPATRPVALDVVPVGAGRVRRRARLDEVEDLEAVGPEQADPFAIGQLERDLVRVGHPMQPEVVVDQPIAGPFRIRRPAQVEDRRPVAEREQPARPEQPGDLGHGQVRVGEGHRAVVAEDDVEAGVRQRHRLGAGMDEREVDAGLGHQPPGVLQLPIGQVEPDRAGAGPGQGDRPLGGPAAELEDVTAGDLAEDQAPLSGICQTPQAIPPLAASCGPLSGLVGVGVGVPGGTVERGMVGQPGDRVRLGSAGSVGHDPRRIAVGGATLRGSSRAGRMVTVRTVLLWMARNPWLKERVPGCASSAGRSAASCPARTSPAAIAAAEATRSAGSRRPSPGSART